MNKVRTNKISENSRDSVNFVSAMSFSKALAQLNALQEQISASLGGNEAQLKEAQKAFAQNLELVQKNMEGLDSRITALKKK